VVTLGRHKDPCSVESLVQLLEKKYTITHPDKTRYKMRNYAAWALEFKREPRAVKALVAVAKNDQESDELRLGN